MNIKKYLKQLIVVAAFFTLTIVPAYAATLGTTLATPESGWQRVDINPSNEFEFSSGINYTKSNNSNYLEAFNRSLVSANLPNETVKFKFSGSNIRIIGYGASNRATDITITIDGITEEMPHHNTPDVVFKNLMYEKRGLSNEPHEIIITSGSSGSTLYIDAIDIDSNGTLLDTEFVIIDDSIILDVVPENTTIETGDFVNVDLKIDNITEIAAEDILIEYDNEKLDFINFEEIDGMKLVHSIVNEDNGTLRVILASQGEANIVNTEEILLTLKFKGIAEGEALIDITKGKVTDGIEMEKDLLEENCDQAIITILPPSDVNNSGEYTLLDLGIDARHFAKDPSIPELSEYNTDVVVNNAIDDADLLEIAREMMLNSNYNL